MKFEQTDRFEGSESTPRYSSFLFIDYPGLRGCLIYVGTESGQIYYFVISKTVLVNKQEELNPSINTGNHSSAVVCLLHSKHRLLYSSITGTSTAVEDGGYIFSGSSDRTVKVWRSNGSPKPLIQTLHGHTAQVSALCDGFDGSILSCSVDGSVRVWTPQQVSLVSIIVLKIPLLYSSSYFSPLYHSSLPFIILLSHIHNSPRLSP